MKKPEDRFKAALAKAYPGMSGEMRRGIVGLAVREFITPGELAKAQDVDPKAPGYVSGASHVKAAHNE